MRLMRSSWGKQTSTNDCDFSRFLNEFVDIVLLFCQKLVTFFLNKNSWPTKPILHITDSISQVRKSLRAECLYDSMEELH